MIDRAVRGACVLGTPGCNVYHMGGAVEQKGGAASETLLASQLRQGCTIDPGVGRICQLGTSGCPVDHGGTTLSPEFIAEMEERMKVISDKMSKLCALDKSRNGIVLEAEDVKVLNRIESAKERIIKGFAK